ncbi:MAG: linear amide C-N hydrolase [Pirellulales bacterium]
MVSNLISTRFVRSTFICLIAMAMSYFPHTAMSCSRVLYRGPDGAVITGRTMDWSRSLETNLWAFPAGLERDGDGGKNALTWTSKYGSVVATCYDNLSVDGMNEMGLVVNVLYLSSSDYPEIEGGRPVLSMAAWAQYVLDSFSTVEETVTELKKESFQLRGLTIPGGYKATVHLVISDATGDSAVFEYLHKKLVVHHGSQYTVMTNDPPYDQQLVLNEYWKEIGGATMLPGTSRPADRFVRAQYYLGESPQTHDVTKQIASVFSVIRNVSVPFSKSYSGKPNIAATLWRTVADQSRLTYYFELSNRPNTFWVELEKMKLGKGQPVRRLHVEGGPIMAGEVSARFVDNSTFTFAVGTDE